MSKPGVNVSPELVRGLAWLGAAVTVIIVIVIVATVIEMILSRDDDYRWLGDAELPSARRSPFAPGDAPTSDADTEVRAVRVVTEKPPTPFLDERDVAVSSAAAAESSEAAE